MTVSSVSRRGASNVVAVIALVIAIAALFFALCSDPIKPGFALRAPFTSGLSSYDFSNPTAAYKSQLQMENNMDIRALMELRNKLKDKELKEKVDTLSVDSELDFKSKKKDEEIDYKILFIKYKSKGKDKKEYVAMKKDADSGLWQSSYLSTYDVESTNKELAKKMREYSDREGPMAIPGPVE